MIIKYCVICNKEIHKGRLSQKQFDSTSYCSTHCFSIARKKRKLIKCKECNKIFEVTVSSNRKYCSKECTTISQKTRIIKYCLYCKKEILAKQNHTFCNQECCNKFYKEFPSLQRVTKICITCGKEFKIHNYRKDSAIFCSRKCKHELNTMTKTCINCKNEFSGAKWSIKNRKFCSLACNYAYKENNTKNVSKWEIEIFNYLKKINPNIEHGKNIKINGKSYFVDLIYKDKIIELNGDYWHCNPFIYDYDYYHKQLKMYAYHVWKKDQEKYKNLIVAGYNSVTIWEWQWDNKKDEVLQICSGFLS